MTEDPQKIGIIGAGSWGKALASVLVDSGHDVILWSRSSLVQETGFCIKNDLSFLIDCTVLFVVVPAQAVRATLLMLKEHGFSAQSRFVFCSKGIEIKTLCLMTDICQDIFPMSKKAVLSGPNFACEVIKKLLTIVSIASDNTEFCEEIASLFTVPYFRTYQNNDMIGTQIIGAAKNILAIACGIATEKHYGDNARASLITRGIEEIGRVIIAKNGSRDIFFTPAGIGDVILTCTSTLSRNFALGVLLAKHDFYTPEISSSLLAEGAASTASLYDMAKLLNVDMPICTSIYQILYEKKSVGICIENLLARPCGRYKTNISMVCNKKGNTT